VPTSFLERELTGGVESLGNRAEAGEDSDRTSSKEGGGDPEEEHWVELHGRLLFVWGLVSTQESGEDGFSDRPKSGMNPEIIGRMNQVSRSLVESFDYSYSLLRVSVSKGSRQPPGGDTGGVVTSRSLYTPWKSGVWIE